MSLIAWGGAVDSLFMALIAPQFEGSLSATTTARQDNDASDLQQGHVAVFPALSLTLVTQRNAPCLVLQGQQEDWIFGTFDMLLPHFGVCTVL